MRAHPCGLARAEYDGREHSASYRAGRPFLQLTGIKGVRACLTSPGVLPTLAQLFRRRATDRGFPASSTAFLAVRERLGLAQADARIGGYGYADRDNCSPAHR